MSHPLRSLLLTFDQLTPEAISTTTGTVTLSQHYRQHSGWKSITTEQAQALCQELKLTLIVVSDSEQENVAPDAPLKFAECSKQTEFSSLDQHLKSIDAPNHTAWVHVDNSALYSPDEVRRVQQTCRKHCSSDTLFAMTAFQMHWQQPAHTFDVLANDNLMRVPAILQHGDFAQFHLQAVTSSNDLLHTLLLHAIEERADLTPTGSIPARTGDGDELWDLRKLAIDPGRFPKRTLVLQFGRFQAIRTQNFLYVAEVDSDVSPLTALKEGLFVKPHDRWNVHNVCSEYVETTETMRQHLGLK